MNRGSELRSRIVPFGADERTWAHDGVHALLGYKIKEAGEVAAALKVELVRGVRMEVPGDVGLDGVQSHEFGLVDAVAPLPGVHAEVVDRPGENAKRLTVEKKVPLADGKGMSLGLVSPGHVDAVPSVF